MVIFLRDIRFTFIRKLHQTRLDRGEEQRVTPFTLPTLTTHLYLEFVRRYLMFVLVLPIMDISLEILTPKFLLVLFKRFREKKIP